MNLIYLNLIFSLLKGVFCMTEKLELYRCNICGNLVEVIIPGVGELVCCGEPMQLLKAKHNDDEMNEKHVPVFTVNDEGKDEVRVGTVLHPMIDDHYIMFIETITPDKEKAVLQYLHPGQEANMLLDEKIGKTLAREFCNLHGLWEGESD